MDRIDKVGEGSYGVVYSAKYKNPENEKDKGLFAVKRNFKELTSDWFGNIHEADLLIRLKGHPFIVDIHKIAIGDPFDMAHPMTPTTANKRKMAEDKMHFILEYVSICGDSYLHSDNFSYANSKIILAQVALALEFMHSKNIIHRDLKPANILMDFQNKVPYAKLCDFGMSYNFIKHEAKTPGVVTCWYRAPEICLGHKDYDFKSDIWSFGCLMFEFMSKEPWLVGIPDDDSKIINQILSRLEEPASEEDLNYLQNKQSKDKKIKIVTKDNMRRRLTYESQLNMRPSSRMEFEKYCGKLNVFVDLMRKCLQINPEKRPSIREVLDHEFFSYYKEYVKSVRAKYHINLNPKIQVVINNSIERKWAINMALNVYNNRHNSYRWYQHNILFHAINLFERYLDWAFRIGNDKVELKPVETQFHGRLFNKQETEMRFWVCLYVMHKYYSTLFHPKTWEKFCPSGFRGEESANENAEYFEYRLIKNACNYKIFEDTIYEMSDKNETLSEEKILKILTFYSNIDNYIGSLDGLYRKYKESVGESIKN